MANYSSTGSSTSTSSDASNSLGLKSKISSTTQASLKITPANSPVLKPASNSRNQYKSTSYLTTLSLQTVIGTTTSSSNGFSYHEPSRSFALCAGSAAVLAELDEDLSVSQRFFRARPTATSVNPVLSFYNPPGPPTTPESRLRPPQASLRLSTSVNSPIFSNSPNAAEWAESIASKSWTSRERIKAVTSVSISPNGRFLAAGETGYNPRILLFSTAKDSSADVPLSIITEHTFGVRSLAFSPNSQFLASLGDINDGFLYIWQINLRNGSAKLHSTNKCTSFVRDMCWMGNNLITSPLPVALSGRNCLLGNLHQSTFTCVSSISDTEAVICSDSGVVCFLDDSNNQQKLQYVKRFDIGVSSVVVDSNSGFIWFGGRSRQLEKCSIDEMRSSPMISPTSANIDTQPCPTPKKASIVSMGIIDTHMITVDSSRTLRICPLDPLSKDNIESVADVSVSAHRDSVLGISTVETPNSKSSDFFTWSCGGTVRFWNVNGTCCDTYKVDLEQISDEDEDANELKVLRATGGIKMFVSGDRYGVVRMVQLFKSKDYSIEVIQTMDEHVGAVGQLLFTKDGKRLLSSSADRTVIIRERMTREDDSGSTVAFLLSKVITLKASPVSIVTPPGDPDTLILSTIDRLIQRYHIPSSRQVHSFRVLDPESGDTAVMSSLILEKDYPEYGPRLLIGVSTTDKSIRVYDSEKDTLLTREFGHTEGVSDVVLLESNEPNSTGAIKRTLISTGLDGVIMVWNLSTQQQYLQESPHLLPHPEEETPTKELTAAKPPLRRILSKTELAGFQKSDNVLTTPTPVRDSPPRIRKKTSRYTLGGGLKNGVNGVSTVSTPPLPPRRSPTAPYSDSRNQANRSPSPPSPRHMSKTVANKTSSGSLRANGSVRRPSMLEVRTRTSSKPNWNSSPNSNSPSEFGSLNMSTEQVCRTLRAYRKKLNVSSDKFNLQGASELERELDLTVRSLGDKMKKTQLNGTKSDSHSNGNTPTACRNKDLSPLASKQGRTARRIPSTPNLSQARKCKGHRTNSLDADGEG
ncbi:WD repeat protein [Trichophyton benhamiae CBS 112371]|uniref:WD repeat protein n=1 Tax=Arthroderma benhamiae (strain ATCC MYA-4681 / CBS 112371) TaxID=663331 RepID=D4AM88_ARTBC|nr:WD repeat protein [Trichophyton benhamiae CBS 112371]EFE35844.1 WD repeat protein [Trichophyton benhamiae CBS 112371]